MKLESIDTVREREREREREVYSIRESNSKAIVNNNVKNKRVRHK